MKILILSILTVAFAAFATAQYEVNVVPGKNTDLCFISYKFEDEEVTSGCIPNDERSVIIPAIFAKEAIESEVLVNFPQKGLIVKSEGIKFDESGEVAFVYLSESVIFDEPSEERIYTTEVIEDTAAALNDNSLRFRATDAKGKPIDGRIIPDGKEEGAYTFVTLDGERLSEFGGPIYAYYENAPEFRFLKFRICIKIPRISYRFPFGIKIKWVRVCYKVSIECKIKWVRE